MPNDSYSHMTAFRETVYVRPNQKTGFSEWTLLTNMSIFDDRGLHSVHCCSALMFPTDSAENSAMVELCCGGNRLGDQPGLVAHFQVFECKYRSVVCQTKGSKAPWPN